MTLGVGGPSLAPAALQSASLSLEGSRERRSQASSELASLELKKGQIKAAPRNVKNKLYRPNEVLGWLLIIRQEVYRAGVLAFLQRCRDEKRHFSVQT